MVSSMKPSNINALNELWWNAGRGNLNRELYNEIRADLELLNILKKYVTIRPWEWDYMDEPMYELILTKKQIEAPGMPLKSWRIRIERGEFYEVIKRNDAC